MLNVIVDNNKLDASLYTGADVNVLLNQTIISGDFLSQQALDGSGFLTTGQTGDYSSYFVNINQMNQSGFLTGLSDGVDSVNSLTAAVTILGTGTNSIIIDGQNIIVTGTETDPIYNAERPSIIFQGNNISLLSNNAGFITSSQGLTGDVTGSLVNNTVTKIQNLSVQKTTPSSGQTYVWNSATTRFEPRTISLSESDPVFVAGSGLFYNKIQSDARFTLKTGASGDVTGIHPNLTVVRIQGRDVTSTAPTGGQVLAWSTGENAWVPSNVSNEGVETDPIYTAAISTIIFNTTTAGGDLTGVYPNPGLRTGIGLSKFVNDANYIKFSSSATGDITGLFSDIKVARIQGIPVTGTPTQSQILSYNSGIWTPTTPFAGGDETDPVYNADKVSILTLSTKATGDVTGIYSGLFIKNGIITALKLASNIDVTTFVNNAIYIKQSDTISGNLSGLFSAPVVYKIQGNPVVTGVPAIGQVLGWNGSEWEHQNAVSVGGAAGGDLIGSTYPNPTIASGIVGLSRFVNDIGILNTNNFIKLRTELFTGETEKYINIDSTGFSIVSNNVENSGAYGYNTNIKDLSTTGFRVIFSDTIQETGVFLHSVVLL